MIQNSIQIQDDSQIFNLSEQEHANRRKAPKAIQLSKSTKYITFTFPNKLIQQKKLSNIDALNQLLNIQLEQHPQYNKMYKIFHNKSKKGEFTSLKCRKCQSRIKYRRRSDESLKLLYYENNHIHYKAQKNQSRILEIIPNVFSEQKVMFTFPIEILKQQHIQNHQKFRKLLNQQEIRSPQYGKIWNCYKSQRKQCPKIFVRCRYCQAQIKYQQNIDKSWTLLQYNNHHNHTTAISKKLNQKDKQKVLTQDKNNQLQSLIKLMQHFEYKYMLIQNEQNKDQLNTIVGVCKGNLKNYERFGQVVGFELYKKCIKSKQNSGKELGVGVFYCFDENYNTINLGFAINEFERAGDFKNIFKYFLQLIQNNIITAFLINQQRKVIKALKSLKIESKNDFQIMLHHHSYIKSFSKQLYSMQLPIKTQILNILKSLLKQNNPVLAKQLLHSLQQILFQYNLSQVFDEFCQKIEYLCIWAMYPKFVGIHFYKLTSCNYVSDISSQRVMSAFNFIKQYEFNVLKDNLRFESYPFQIFFNDYRIKQVRYAVYKYIFEIFINHCRLSQHYCLIQQSLPENLFIIKNLINKEIYRITNQQCECTILKKIGIPCQHIIFLIHNSKINSSSYLKYFNPRWISQRLTVKIEQNRKMDQNQSASELKDD